MAKINNKNKPKLQSVEIKHQEMKLIGTVDERFQSYNIEMAEVIGGNFWKPYDQIDPNGNNDSARTTNNDEGLYSVIPPIDLYQERLRNLALELGPLT